jgi:tRNA-Thr(GGU) m(6)t(6)A37 methyltransferase TsaA
MDAVNIVPIGVVETNAFRDEVRDRSRVSRIILRSRLEKALEGLDEFSHLYVLFWMHDVPNEEKPLKVHPRGRKELPKVGVLSTRSRLRPNSIGLTLVELLSVEGSALTVRGLDAFDGTPILDIKPFDGWDVAEDARVPGWWLKLEKEKKRGAPVNR